MDAEQRLFLADECLWMTLLATLQRARAYQDRAPDDLRAGFREDLWRELKQVVEEYRDEVSEETHVRNICELSDRISRSHGTILRPDRHGGGRFRIGLAQKALNLWLKYMWCLGEIPTPPHCPFDSNIIDALPGCGHIKWTKLDSVDEYTQLARSAVD